MIRQPRDCGKGHTYEVVTATKYHGKAAYPADCPDCRKKR